MAAFHRLLFLVAAFAVAAGGTARAVIVAGGDGTQNTTAPADDFGFEDVAQVAAASGVYLGNGWILTAYHVVTDGGQGFAFGSITLDGQSYTANPSTAFRITNADGTDADLALFRLTTVPPGLAGASIASATPALGTNVVMAGDGRDRSPNQAQWLIDPKTDDWTQTDQAGDAQGYFWANTQSLRWGLSSTVAFDGGAPTMLEDDGYGVTEMIATGFTDQAGNAIAAVGDSGGGVFEEIGSNWFVAGSMLDLGTLDGQPPETAVFGDQTISADLSEYRAEILAVIPEPGAGWLGAVGLCAGLCARRLRRRGRRQR